MVETGVLFDLIDSLQQFDSLVRKSHFQVIAAIIESTPSSAPAHFANETPFIIY